MNKKIKIEPFIERLNNADFKRGTKFKFLDKVYLYDFPNLVGVYEIGKPTKPEYSIFAQLDMINLHCEVEILEDNTEEIEELDIPASKMIYDVEPLKDKINELVKAINSIRKDKNE